MMTHTGLELFMENLKQLIYGNDNPLINNPSVLYERPQLRLLYEELGSIIHTLFIHEDHQVLELKEVRNLKKRFKDAAEEAQDIIDLFLSAVHFRNRGLFPRPDVFKTSLNLENVMRSIESIKVEFMAINIDNMKMDSSPIMDSLKTRSAAAAGTSCIRYPSGTKKLSEEIVVGLDRDVELIRDKLAEDSKQLGIVSIVGMGGLGKTTLATIVFNDRFILYHFSVRAWVAVSQTYTKRDLLIQILASIGVQLHLEEDSDFKLGEKLYKRLMGKRYLIVIDDIWSFKAWDDLKLFLPCENTGSRILFTTRLNEVALHVKPQGFLHSLPYLTEEQSWELLREKVFHGNECPEWLVKPGMQIAKKCQGLPLSVVVMAGILAKEAESKILWEKIACSVNSYIVSDQKGCLETLALSYHHLPRHLRDCFLYLGGFPEDHRIHAERLIWLWGAEGFIEAAGNQSLEDTAKAYLMDLVDRNLLIVAERKFDGDVKACKVHDLVRELCLEKAKEEIFFLKIDSQLGKVITPYKQRRLFTNRDIYMVNLAHPPTPTIRSLLCFHNQTCHIDDIAEYFRSFVLLRVLDLRECELIDIPQGMALMVHLRYLAIWHSLGFPSSICNLWSLQTLVLKISYGPMVLPSTISNLVNLRHLWSNKELYLPCIGKPMNLQSISKVVLGEGVESFQKCFPNVKKLASTDSDGFELLPYLETLKLTGLKGEPMIGIRFPTTLKKLTLVSFCLPWSHMSIIQSLPNLEILKLEGNADLGTLWNTGEEQFRSLKFLRLERLYLKQWKVSGINFPCLRRLQVLHCHILEEIPLEIGDISTLELLEVTTDIYYYSSDSIIISLQSIQSEQHAVGNYELKINFQGQDLASFLNRSSFENMEDQMIKRVDELATPSYLVVALAVSGSRKTEYVVEWALDKFAHEGMLLFKLFFVRPKITWIQILMATVPISEVGRDTVIAYHDEVKWQVYQKLRTFWIMCARRKVQAEIVQIESDDVVDAIKREILKSNITKLVIGASTNGKISRGRSLSLKISESIPSFCTVYTISNGKLSSLRPGSANNSCDLSSVTNSSGAGPGGRGVQNPTDLKYPTQPEPNRPLKIETRTLRTIRFGSTYSPPETRPTITSTYPGADLKIFFCTFS